MLHILYYKLAHILYYKLALVMLPLSLWYAKL